MTKIPHKKTIWIIQIGEPLIEEQERTRYWRCLLLANRLIEDGYRVIWWTSGFDHFQKKNIANKLTIKKIKPGIRQVFLPTIGYSKNISICRIINHVLLGFQFNKNSERFPKPNLIFSGFPTIELAFLSVRYGNKNSIPVVLDIRDLWPDVFVSPFPKYLKKTVQLFLYPFEVAARYAIRNATSIVGISEGYLKWAEAKGNNSDLNSVFPLGYKKKSTSEISNIFIDKLFCKNGINKTKSVFIFSGTFGHTYDITTIIQAAKMFSRCGDDRVLVLLVGKGENEQMLRNQAQGCKNVVFTGWLDGDSLAILLARSVAGFAAYKDTATQGLPNKFMEYMSAGLPILSSLGGEGKKFIEDNQCGKYYPPGDEKKLAQLMVEFVDKPDLVNEMRRNSRQLFESKFNEENVYTNLKKHLTKHILQE